MAFVEYVKCGDSAQSLRPPILPQGHPGYFSKYGGRGGDKGCLKYFVSVKSFGEGLSKTTHPQGHAVLRPNCSRQDHCQASITFLPLHGGIFKYQFFYKYKPIKHPIQLSILKLDGVIASQSMSI